MGTVLTGYALLVSRRVIREVEENDDILYELNYEGETISNQPIPFPIDRDGHNFLALFQYMFYTWVQNCTLVKSFFNKILNVKHG